jgi:hypothetical protein
LLPKYYCEPAWKARKLKNFIHIFFIYNEQVFSFEKNQRILLNCGALSTNLFLKFFSARQLSEIFLNESSKNTENDLIEWLRKETTRHFMKINVYVVSLIKSGFQNCFWNLFSISGLSQICLIRNVWKPSPNSRNTLISCSEKSSLSLKSSF